MNSLPPHPGKIILRAAEANAWIDGYAFLDRARQRADEQEALILRAREEGHVEGFEAGRRDGEARAAELLVTTQRDVKRYLDGLGPELAELALTLVRRILGEFDDVELITRCVRHALSEWRHEHRIHIRVAPTLALQVTESLAASPPGATDYQVEADAQLTPTQCLLVSPIAVMDIGMESQLEALRCALQDDREGP